ncbi:MAG: hypothetical protein H7289_06065 [Mucilaginibacter sp.]|nr:hypothetical protein [Mucilaginibacter sp.]
MDLQSQNISGKDFYDDLPQSVKDDIEQGLREIENGNVYAHEDVMKEIKERFGLK